MVSRSQVDNTSDKGVQIRDNIDNKEVTVSVNLYKKGSIWYADYLVEGQRYRKSTGERDYDKAYPIAQQMKQEALGSVKRGVKGMDLEQAVKRAYKEHFAHLASAESLKASERDVLNFFGAKTKLEDITNEDIEDWKDDLLTRKFTKTTINHRFSYLRKVFWFAVYKWKVPGVDVPVFPYFKLNNKKVRYLTENEERVLVESLNQEQADFVKIQVDTGMRLGESINLTWEAINWEERLIHIWDSKNNHPRSIPMTDRVYGVLARRYQEAQTRYVWEMSKYQIQYAFDKATKNVGIKDVNLHTLRHTFASRLAMAGVELSRIRDLLGHTTIKTTERYAHLQPDNLRDAINHLNTSHEDGRADLTWGVGKTH